MSEITPYHVYEDSAGWITRPAWDAFLRHTRDSWIDQIHTTGLDYQSHYQQCLALMCAEDQDPHSDMIHFKSEQHLTLFLLRYSS